MIKPKKLHFATAGIPLCIKDRDYIKGLQYNLDKNLSGLEMEFVRGVRMKEKNIPLIKEFVKNNNFLLTAHGPYYINLNAQEDDKYEASLKRILDTARMAHKCGAYSITFHAAYYLQQDPDKVYDRVKKALTDIVNTLKSENIEIWVRPELTGKSSQWGNLEELIQISKDVEMVLPCIDFSHMHARLNGYNGYDNFSRILESMATKIGEVALESFHGHVAGIEYTNKGEKKHLNLQDSDFKYKELIKALNDFHVKGLIVCESPNIEEDTKLLADLFHSLCNPNS
ncbi:MAG: TIM barrel protein [Cyanobacteriota bacterium]